MKNKIIDIVAGARPNFMKVAALFAVADKFPSLTLRLVHTGQHYDEAMSDVFFRDLGLPKPECHLGVGSDTHAAQTAQIMTGYEGWVNENRPDICLVVGDVNSTLACSLVAAKMGIPVAHVEAGLRSFDRTMPEEVNRVVTDSISELMFVTEPSGLLNLAREGRPSSAIHLVGHVMIDTLLRKVPEAKTRSFYSTFGLSAGEYAFVTLHRPANVDDPKVLAEIVAQIDWLAHNIPVVFALHPRTKKQLQQAGLYKTLQSTPAIQLTEPLSYLDALSLTMNAKVVVTDSGGLQEETSALSVPCLTLRDTTERPITITEGTNTLISGDWDLFRTAIARINDNCYLQEGSAIPLWDGKAGERILRILEEM